jgi:hypothetical protein
MKLNTTKQYNLSVDYYTFIDTPSGNTTVRTYSLDSNIKVSTSGNIIGNLIILADEVLLLGGRLQNLLDRSGAEILPGAVWQITTVQPVINALGLLDGYKYKATAVSGI